MEWLAGGRGLTLLFFSLPPPTMAATMNANDELHLSLRWLYFRKAATMICSTPARPFSAFDSVEKAWDVWNASRPTLSEEDIRLTILLCGHVPDIASALAQVKKRMHKALNSMELTENTCPILVRSWKPETWTEAFTHLTLFQTKATAATIPQILLWWKSRMVKGGVVRSGLTTLELLVRLSIRREERSPTAPPAPTPTAPTSDQWTAVFARWLPLDLQTVLVPWITSLVETCLQTEMSTSDGMTTSSSSTLLAVMCLVARFQEGKLVFPTKVWVPSTHTHAMVRAAHRLAWTTGEEETAWPAIRSMLMGRFRSSLSNDAPLHERWTEAFSDVSVFERRRLPHSHPLALAHAVSSSSDAMASDNIVLVPDGPLTSASTFLAMAKSVDRGTVWALRMFKHTPPRMTYPILETAQPYSEVGWTSLYKDLQQQVCAVSITPSVVFHFSRRGEQDALRLQQLEDVPPELRARVDFIHVLGQCIESMKSIDPDMKVRYATLYTTSDRVVTKMIPVLLDPVEGSTVRSCGGLAWLEASDHEPTWFLEEEEEGGGETSPPPLRGWPWTLWVPLVTDHDQHFRFCLWVMTLMALKVDIDPRKMFRRPHHVSVPTSSLSSQLTADAFTQKVTEESRKILDGGQELWRSYLSALVIQVSFLSTSECSGNIRLWQSYLSESLCAT